MRKRLFWVLLGTVFVFLISWQLKASRGVKAQTVKVSLYRVFETTILREGVSGNKFNLWINATFTSPSGKTTNFWGFYDGNGNGGQEGNVWKLRFMPTEVGRWTYQYTWSDGAAGGSGEFDCISSGAGKGILKPYQNNSHWFGYNGNEPVFLESYYILPGGVTGHPLDWTVSHVYQKIVDRGYNHIQMESIPISYANQRFETSSFNGDKIFTGTRPSQAMKLNRWHLLEDHLKWLNERDIGIHTFQGFDGKTEGPRWTNLSSSEKEFYVKYVCARLAPLANIAGWNYTWETAGDGPELELMHLLDQYDPWDHLRTYEHALYGGDSFDDTQWYRPEYTFIALEPDTHFERDTPSHHFSTVQAYETKGAHKPVFMSEGAGLWMDSGCHGGNSDTVRRTAWAVTTGGGSFTWMDNLSGTCADGEPSSSNRIFSTSADEYLDILYQLMTNDLEFSKMTPHDELLSNHDTDYVYCLAEPGRQYLIFSQSGKRFSLSLAGGQYRSVWVDTKTGSRQDANGGTVDGGSSVSFTPPNTSTDWVLLAKLQGAGPTATPTPSLPTFKQLLLNWLTATLDQNNDGKVNSLDFAKISL